MTTRLLLLALLLVAAGSCIELDLGLDDEDCTEIGCSDGVTVSLRHDGTWVDGAYEFQFDLDGKDTVCTTNLPADLPTAGESATISCSPALSVTLGQEFECKETKTKDAVSQSCQPIADRWLIRAQIDTTPHKLKLRVVRDDEQLLSKSVDLKYKDVRPNGEDCGPVCSQSSADLKLE